MINQYHESAVTVLQNTLMSKRKQKMYKGKVQATSTRRANRAKIDDKNIDKSITIPITFKAGDIPDNIKNNAHDAVNHIRHVFTNYEEVIKSMDTPKASRIFKKRILSAISTRYPQYYNECMRQYRYLM